MAIDRTNPSSNITHNEYARRLAEQSRTPAEYLVDTKIYFHHHNFARFHIDLGDSRVKTIAFANGRYLTDDKREQDQLDMVADVPGTFIYTLPDNDARREIEEERQRELYKSVQQTAEARALSNKQNYDPNVPVVPVNVQPVAATNLNVYPVGGNVGMQSSMRGIGAPHLQPTTAQDQTVPPQARVQDTGVSQNTNSTDRAVEELNVLAEQAAAKRTPPNPS